MRELSKQKNHVQERDCINDTQHQITKSSTVIHNGTSKCPIRTRFRSSPVRPKGEAGQVLEGGGGT